MSHPHLTPYPSGQPPMGISAQSNVLSWGAPTHAQPSFQPGQIVPPGSMMQQQSQYGWASASGPSVPSHYQQSLLHGGVSAGAAATPTPDVKAATSTPPPASAGPVSSLSFPPGLLPRLCRDKERHSRAYTPLDPRDIEREGNKDAYFCILL
jgi:hypothetical protein